MKNAKCFLEKYQELNKEDAWLWKFLCYLLEFFGTLLVLTGKDFLIFAISFWVFAVILQMKGYMGWGERQEKKSIYEILKYTPVNPWDLFRILLERLVICVGKRILYLEVVQIGMMLCTGAFSWKGFLLPALYGICMMTGGMEVIMPRKMRERYIKS